MLRTRLGSRGLSAVLSCFVLESCEASKQSLDRDELDTKISFETSPWNWRSMLLEARRSYTRN